MHVAIFFFSFSAVPCSTRRSFSGASSRGIRFQYKHFPVPKINTEILKCDYKKNVLFLFYLPITEHFGNSNENHFSIHRSCDENRIKYMFSKHYSKIFHTYVLSDEICFQITPNFDQFFFF